LAKTQILLCINDPAQADLKKLSEHTLIIGAFDNNPESDLIKLCQKNKLSLISMNKIPRTSRAQSMDSLSSQANLAGYRAVFEAALHYKRAIPMMMTAAGMIQPAKVLILGAGVAGLQAIATAKRIGAIIYAFDVRLAAKEQVESLGAEFIAVSEEDADTKSGYASETSDEYKQLQAILIDKYAKMVDIIICTALIPDRKAPLLLHKDTVKQMKAGSVIVDLATARGGNCELSEHDKTIKHGDITIIGNTNISGLVPTTASELYANNLLHLVQLLTQKPGEITLNPEDDIVAQSLLCKAGVYLPFQQQKESQ
jgi:NAD(P) transhydrogenase subunit alpha